MTEEELDVLIDRYFEGDLSDPEEAALWDRLRKDPEAADRFVEQSELESALHERYRERAIAPPTLPLPKPKPPPQRRWAAGPLAAAAVVLLGVAAFIAFLVSRGAPATGGKTEEVAAEIPVLESVAGETFVLTTSGRTPAVSGQRFFSGLALETSGPRGRAVLAYPDGSRVEAQSNTLVRQPEVSRETGKRLILARGTLRAKIGRQSKERPMRVTTPQGEALVRGTSFWLVVEPGPEGTTRVAVTEGRVMLSDARDGVSVDIEAGHEATAGSQDMNPVPMPVDEITLLPSHARLVGTEWTRVDDPDSGVARVLDVPDLYRPQEWIPDLRTTSRSWAEFTFHAEAGREYHLWIRARCMNGDHQSDWIIAELIGGEFVGRPNGHQGRVGDPRLHYMNGYFLRKGYHWAGGDIEKRPNEDFRKILGVVRFARTGMQILRLHAKEGPMRVAAVRLSTRQTTLPPADMIK